MKYLVRTVLSFAFILLFVCSVAFAGAAENVKLFVPSPENPVSLGIVAVPGAQYGTIDQSRVNMTRAQQDIEIPVTLPNAQTVALSLHAFSVFTPYAKFYAVTNSGVIALPPPDISLYRGTVAGDDSSIVYLALCNKLVTGFITTGSHHYSIGTVKADAASGIIYQLYDMANVPPGVIQASCAASDGTLPPGLNYKSFEQQNRNDNVLSNDRTEAHATAVQFTVPVAVDVDYEAYQFWNNDSSAVEQYVAQMFGAISTVYQTEANTQINISFFRVWETPDEPYTDQPSGVGFDQNGIDSAIQQEASYWQQSMDTVNRASVMLITKKNMCGDPNAACGLGYLDYFDGNSGYHLGVLCNNAYAYAITCVSGNASFPQEDQVVAAHELGHNFGCNHTQNCFWMDSGYTQTPIDMCVPPEGGSCYSGTAQSVGTIMSYCNQVQLTFGSVVGTWLKNHIVQNEHLWTCMVPAQKITAIADSVDFGVEQIRVNKDTTFSSFLTNTGAQSVTVNSMKITGANSSDFSFVSGQTPIPFTLSPGQRHAVKMRFTPSDSGDRVAELTITSTASGSPIVIGLHGFGAFSSAVDGGLPVPQMFRLDQNFPNPVVESDAGLTTTIHYSLATGSRILLSVYDLYGRVVASLVSGAIAPGSYSVAFDASSLPSGTYYYKLQSASGSLVRMLTVVR